MKNELKKYINGKVDYTPLLNIFMSKLGREREVDPYNEIGEYIVDLCDGNLPGKLSYFQDRLNKKIKSFSSFKKNGIYSTIAISFLTSIIDSDVLKKLFGEPIYHDEFGEGFEGDYNEETDEYDEPDIKESYASYFVKINGIKFHIGYDHRGTNIELEENIIIDSAIKDIKKLIDMVLKVI